MARILIVEDDDIQLEMREQILENAGYEVVTAQNASEALERLPGCPVVVMDLRIPGPEDGERLIRAIDGTAKIIVLSGGEIDPTLPVDEFLTKPCPSKRLLASIEKWISESK
jgi:CheY-like chemotaxis protein